ncbi:MAG: helix-turn-helix transcriptional regulator, partial [Shimia sp.]|nr:helix-turn-helix transcriptional regulator [Shimia sp.]
MPEQQSSRAKTSSKKMRRQEAEALILSAAEKVFAEAGFGGATMQLIADMAGLPKANLHYYFPTKE